MKLLRVQKLPTVRPRNAWAPCPCGHGQPYRRCCEGAARAAERRPPGTQTGYRHENCYARQLGDCSQGISKEHPLSAAVLRRLTVGGTVRVRDFAFQDAGDVKHLAPASLAPAVLCERHNSALSQLDEAGTEFFVRMESVVRSASGGGALKSRELFNGPDIERWLLKMTAGHIAGGWAKRDARQVPNWWPDVIWGARPLVAPDGLYLLNPGAKNLNHGVRLAAMYDVEHPVGCYVEILGFTFILLAQGEGKTLPLSVTAAAHRLSHIIARGGGRTMTTEIEFPGQRPSGVIVEIKGSIDENANRVPDCWREG